MTMLENQYLPLALVPPKVKFLKFSNKKLTPLPLFLMAGFFLFIFLLYYLGAEFF